VFVGMWMQSRRVGGAPASKHMTADIFFVAFPYSKWSGMHGPQTTSHSQSGTHRWEVAGGVPPVQLGIDASSGTPVWVPFGWQTPQLIGFQVQVGTHPSVVAGRTPPVHRTIVGTTEVVPVRVPFGAHAPQTTGVKVQVGAQVRVVFGGVPPEHSVMLVGTRGPDWVPPELQGSNTTGAQVHIGVQACVSAGLTPPVHGIVGNIRSATPVWVPFGWHGPKAGELYTHSGVQD